MSECERCQKRVKDWNGDDPTCAFLGGVFNIENWNCATMNELRSLAESSTVWSEDNNFGVVPYDGLFVLMKWYKRRGRTDFAGVFDDRSSHGVEPLSLHFAEMLLDKAPSK